MRRDFNFSIAVFSLKKGYIEKIIKIKPISAIWNNNSKVFYTNNRGPIKLYSLDKNQNIDSIDIENYGYCPIKVCKPIFLLSLYLDIK